MRERAVQKSFKSQPTSLLKPRTFEPGWINLSELVALSDVFSFWVNSILQGSSNAQSLLCGEVDVLFDIPLIGLFKAVRFESYPFHDAILLWKIAVSRSKSLVGSTKSKGARGRGKKRFLDTDYADVRGFWLGQLQIPSFQSSTGVVQFVFLGSVLRLTSINKVINSQ